MKSETILIYNSLAYILMALFFLRKDHFKVTVQNIPFLWLAIGAFSSYMFYIQPGFEYTVHYSIMQIHPFVYLFFCLFILFVSFRFVQADKLSVQIPYRRFMKVINFTLPFLVLLVLIHAYDVLHTNLANMADVREDLYSGGLQKNPFLNFYVINAIDRILTHGITVFICLSFFALVFIPKTPKVVCFIISPYVLACEIAFSTATRATFFFIIAIFVFQYFLYRPYMSKKMNNVVRSIFILGGGSFGLLIFAMTIARFSDSASLFFYKYAGEAMINFNGLLFDHVKGTTDGVAYFWYIPNLLGIDGFKMGNNLEWKWDLIQLKTGVPGLYFYTIVGGFIFEFGKIATPFIIVVLSILLIIYFRKKGNLSKLIVISWIAYLMFESTFLFPLQGDGGVINTVLLLSMNKYLSKG